MIQVGEKEVRQRVLEAIHRYGIKQVDIARDTGINHSSLSLWLQAKIKGHFVKIEETLEEWLKSMHSNKNHFSSIGASSRALNKNIHDKNLNDPNDHLIPISIDLELEGLRFREFFLWNAYEPGLTAESFSKLVCEENQFPAIIEKEMAEQIKRQVNSYKPYDYSNKEEEVLRVIEIDVRIDNIQLKDRIEWDINDISNNPDKFAYNLAEEMNLNGEFAQRISHQIREQILYHQKQILQQKNGIKTDYSLIKKSTRSLLENNSAYDKKQNSSYVVTQDNYLRPIFNNDDTEHLKQWEPRIDILDANEIKKIQQLEERKYRYIKRRL